MTREQRKAELDHAEMIVVEARYELMRQMAIYHLGGERRLTQLRANRGVVGALEHLMLDYDGKSFAEVRALGLERYSAEAIVAGHPDVFSKAAYEVAIKRLNGTD